MKLFSILTMFTLLLSVTTSHAQAVSDKQWQDALSSDHRSQKHIDRNQYRHPKQTLEFLGLKANMKVVEIWPGGSAWYTEVLAPVLHKKGQLYAAHWPKDSHVKFFKNSRQKFDQKIKTHDFYSNIITIDLHPPHTTADSYPNDADMVLTFRNVHNWMKSDTHKAMFESFYNMLKPGGVLGVIEHRAKDGTSLKDMIQSGYVTEKFVIAEAEAAGFRLVDRSEVNANPKDGTIHPKGVWTLPPSLRLGDEKKDHYLGIGESDRMTLKFIKPKK